MRKFVCINNHLYKDVHWAHPGFWAGTGVFDGTTYYLFEGENEVHQFHTLEKLMAFWVANNL